MNIKVQKQDGSQVEIAANPVCTLTHSGVIESFPTGTNDLYPEYYNGMRVYQLASETGEGCPSETQGYLVDIRGYGNSSVQIIIPFIWSYEPYTNGQRSIYIRSLSDIQRDMPRGWTEWRRIPFYDEIAPIAESIIQSACPFPVGMTIDSGFVESTANNNADLLTKRYAGTTWAVNYTYYTINNAIGNIITIKSYNVKRTA